MGHKTPSVPGVSSYHFWDATINSLFFWDISHEVACKWWLTLGGDIHIRKFTAPIHLSCFARIGCWMTLVAATSKCTFSRCPLPRISIRLRSGSTVFALATRTTRQTFRPCMPQHILQPCFTRGYAAQPPGGGFPNFLQPQHQKGDALREYVSGTGHLFNACVTLSQSIDLTDMARNGKLDPVIGRDEGEYHR